jgi:hypothetical protein
MHAAGVLRLVLAGSMVVYGEAAPTARSTAGDVHEVAALAPVLQDARRLAPLQRQSEDRHDARVWVSGGIRGPLKW